MRRRPEDHRECENHVAPRRRRETVFLGAACRQTVSIVNLLLPGPIVAWYARWNAEQNANAQRTRLRERVQEEGKCPPNERTKPYVRPLVVRDVGDLNRRSNLYFSLPCVRTILDFAQGRISENFIGGRPLFFGCKSASTRMRRRMRVNFSRDVIVRCCAKVATLGKASKWWTPWLVLILIASARYQRLIASQ